MSCRRVKDGIVERLFRKPHAYGIVKTAQPFLLLDSKGGLTCKIHMMTMDAQTAAEFIPSGGQ